MQMAVNAFELAGACTAHFINRNKPQQLIGQQFIASNNFVVGFQLVAESILILHSEGAHVASASLQMLELSRMGTYEEYPYQEFHLYRAQVQLLVLRFIGILHIPVTHR
jgi:hypothetical protein